MLDIVVVLSFEECEKTETLHNKYKSYIYLFMLLSLSTLVGGGGGGPFLLFHGVSPPASPARHLVGLLRRRDHSTYPNYLCSALPS